MEQVDELLPGDGLLQDEPVVPAAPAVEPKPEVKPEEKAEKSGRPAKKAATRADNPFHPDNLEKTLTEDDSPDLSDTKKAAQAEPETPAEPSDPASVPVTADGDQSKPETPEATEQKPRKYAGHYDTPEALEQGYTNLQSRFGQMSSEVGDLRKAIAALSSGEGQPPSDQPQDRATPPDTTPEPEFVDYRGKSDPATGFPLDELGVPTRPVQWWNEQRFAEWVEACEGDEDAAKLYLREEYDTWREKYNEQRTEKKYERSRSLDSKVQAAGEKQKARIPQAMQELVKTFLAVHPEDEATKMAERVFGEAIEIVKSGVASNKYTILKAASPEMVDESIGEAFAKLWREGKLGEVLYPSGAGGARKPPGQPQPGAGGAPEASRNGASKNGSKPKVTVTDEHRELARVYTKMQGKTVTPEEVAADELEDDGR